jgi:hypothetical protein
MEQSAVSDRRRVMESAIRTRDSKDKNGTVTQKNLMTVLAAISRVTLPQAPRAKPDGHVRKSPLRA